MRSSRRRLATLLMVVFGPVSTLADTVGVTPRKLVLIDRTDAGAFQKGTYVVRDEVAGIHKGPGTDVGDVSARFDVGYDSAFGPITASFPMPPGANDGVKGWLANTATVATYKNKEASRHLLGNEVALGILRQDKMIKVKLKGLGGLGELAAMPTGPITTCYTIDNGGSVHQFGSSWPLSTCTYIPVPGGAKLICKAGGLPDTSRCASSPSGAFLDAEM